MQSSLKHTPGPWRVHKYFPDRIVLNGHENRSVGASIHEREDRENCALVVAHADRNEYSKFAHEISAAEQRANARLIAAAPDMLALLIDLYEHGYVTSHDHDKVAAMIAKATGQ